MKWNVTRDRDAGPATVDAPSGPGGGAPQRVPRRRRSRWVARWPVWAARIGILVAGLLFWEFASGNPNKGALFDQFMVGKPSAAWSTLVEWVNEGILWHQSLITLTETLIGFAIGAVAGMIVGVLLGASAKLSDVFFPFVIAAYSAPRLALTPLLVLWFGLGMASKIVLAAILVFFLVFFSTYAGVRQVDRDLINVMRVVNASRWTIHRVVTLPSAAAHVITGIRMSVSYAFVGAVVGELVAGNTGLGALISQEASAFNPSGIFAAIAVLIVMALLLQMIVTWVEHRALRWQTDKSSETGFSSAY
jgi:sulfonate transport system permease protein